MRPECAGWHEASTVCDGDAETGEPACAYRERCLLILDLVGGRHDRHLGSVGAVLRQHDEGALSALLERRQAQSRPSVRPLAGKSAEKRSGVVLVHPKGGAYTHTWPLVEAIAARFARTIDRPLVEESDGPAFGDIYLRWLPGHKGRQVVLYSYTGANVLGFWICRIEMQKRGTVTLKINCDDYGGAMALDPPRGVVITLNKDKRTVIRATGVSGEHARDAGRWLGDLLLGGMIGKGSKPHLAPGAK